MIQVAVAAAAAFNLVCTGTVESEDIFSGKQIEPYSYTYRIDLATKRWCDGECLAPKDIAAVLPTALILSPKRDIETPTVKDFRDGSIDRRTGRHSILSSSGRGRSILLMKWEGQCEKQPFTGFPKFDTKF
jgi:hypothetical protein